ncbi:uncharacterized protein LOC124934557 [Impatiens glandulifera]|uniref:uncharacterized protein LOC124934557 n=1 Tax=Impatiens glandulifera TaxID=253017 RepID=UPI001FB147B3|nr:uncharacterized protein LOC124934557 [Impatiens glandulifera]
MFCELLREKGLQDNSNVTVEESIAMFLLVLGHGVKLRVLGGIYIRSLETISRRFHEDCLGALDGTHVEMTIPLKAQGSSSDSKVLRSALVRERDPFLVPTGFLAPYRSTRYHLNEWSSHARNSVERTFGLLKKRWAVLRQPLFFGTNTQVRIINACCVLHNYIREIASELDYPLLHEVDYDLSQQSNEVFDVDYEDVITNVQGGSQWTNFRDDMAMEMYSQYQVRSGRT